MLFSENEARAKSYGCTFKSITYVSFVMIFINTVINIVNTVK